MATPGLRDRIRQADAADYERRAAPVLMALESAAREIRASAHALEAAAHRPTLKQAVILVAAGALLCWLTILLTPLGQLTSIEKRQLHLGAQLEAVWPSLSETEKAQLRAQLQRSKP